MNFDLICFEMSDTLYSGKTRTSFMTILAGQPFVFADWICCLLFKDEG